MRLNQITPPKSEPITIADFEGQARLGAGTVDALGETMTVNLFIGAVRQRAETITRRALVTQTWEMVLDRFPCGRQPVEIPLPPLQSIVSITYIDPSGTLQTLAPSMYRAESDQSPTCQPAQVLPAYGQSWPATLNDVGTVRIRFVCGYGPETEGDANMVPEGVKQWMLLNVASLYENREAQTVASGRLTEVDLSSLADSLLDPFRIYRW